MTAVDLYTAAIATVAAGGGIAALTWQIYTWRKRRATKLGFEVDRELLLEGGGRMRTQAVIVRVINHSEHPVHVANVGFQRQDGSKRWAGTRWVNPFSLQPDRRNDLRFDPKGLKEAGIDIEQELIVAARSEDGRQFRSKPLRLEPLDTPPT